MATPAYDNFTRVMTRVGSRIRLLEQLYTQVKTSCAGLEDYIRNLPYETEELGHLFIQEDIVEGITTYEEVLEIIGIYLKIVAGKNTREESDKLYDSSFYQAGLQISTVEVGQDLTAEEAHINEYIPWLYYVLNQCRRTQRSVRTLQQRSLQNLYQPGGPMYRKGEEEVFGPLA